MICFIHRKQYNVTVRSFKLNKYKTNHFPAPEQTAQKALSNQRNALVKTTNTNQNEPSQRVGSTVHKEKHGCNQIACDDYNNRPFAQRDLCI